MFLGDVGAVIDGKVEFLPKVGRERKIPESEERATDTAVRLQVMEVAERRFDGDGKADVLCAVDDSRIHADGASR